MNDTRQAAIAAVLFTISGVAAAATDLPRYGVFVYSDLCTERGSGDTAGTRITLLRLSDGEKVIYEYSEGALMWPLFGTQVTVDTKSSRLTFTIHTELGETRTLSGTLTDEALTIPPIDGPAGNEAARRRIPRVTDFSLKRPICR